MCVDDAEGALANVTAQFSSAAKDGLLSSVPIANNNGSFQFCVTMVDNTPVITDIAIDVSESVVTHPELMPKLMPEVLQHLTTQINKILLGAIGLQKLGSF